MDLSKHRAILRLLGDPMVPETSNDKNAPLPLISSISTLTSQIGAFLEQAKNAPEAVPMDIEIDEEEMYNEDDFANEDDNEQQDDEDLEFDGASMKFVRKQKLGQQQPPLKKRKGNLIQVVSSKRVNDDDDDDEQDEYENDEEEELDRADDLSSSGSSINIVTFSSDDDEEIDENGNKIKSSRNDGIDLSNLSEAKKQKLVALFTGANMKKHGAKQVTSEERDDDNDENEEEQEEEEEENQERNPLRGKMIQMNVVAGVLQEDPELARRKRSCDLVLPTPVELMNEKRKTKKNQAKLAKLIQALIQQ
jgi:hypothetical protein